MARTIAAVAALALALAVCPGVQAQATGSTDTSGWDSRWSTPNCTGSTVGAVCAELNSPNFTYVPVAGGDGYFWQSPNPNGQHGGCNPFGAPSGASVGRGCGTATFRIYCHRTSRVQFVAEGQAAVLAGNDDSMWSYVDGLVQAFTLTSGWQLAPTWNFVSVLGSHQVFTPGTHTLTLAEREDATRVRRVAFSAGYPDCQFGAPPPTPNVTAETVRQQVLQLETDTNNRVSLVSTMIDALNSTIQSTAAALSGQISTAISTHESTMMADMSTHESMAMSAQQSMAAVTTQVSNAIAAVTTRLGTLGSVSSFSTGGSGGGAVPQVSTSGQDVTVAAGSGGTVRVQGGQCQADLCGLVGQVSTLTDALRAL